MPLIDIASQPLSEQVFGHTQQIRHTAFATLLRGVFGRFDNI
jgi:hypothetical protein